MKKKILFIILDGLGDRPIKKFGNKTPLEEAETPNFDFLAKNGICGLVQPLYLKKFPTSKEGHLGLFGYNLKKWNIKRGVFEVIGMGMRLKKDDIAFRGNFATVDKNFKIVDRRAGRIQNTLPLIRTLNGMKIKKVKFLLTQGVSHRLGLIMRGRNLSEKISDGDLYKTNIHPPKIKPLNKSYQAKFTANVLNEFLKISHQILKDHPFNKKRIKKGLLPANYILLREGGKLRKIPSFQEKWGMKACCIAGGSLYKGIGKVLGMDLMSVKGATGKPNTNIEGKFQKALSCLKKYDFVYCHIKGTDIFSHDGDAEGKKKFIEKIDKKASLFLGLKNTILIITGDHSTPCALKEHSSHPVPVLVYGIGKDRVSQFSERECQKGKLGLVKSTVFLKKILKMAES